MSNELEGTKQSSSPEFDQTYQTAKGRIGHMARGQLQYIDFKKNLVLPEWG